jgi:hypothetical protein
MDSLETRILNLLGYYKCKNIIGEIHNRPMNYHDQSDHHIGSQFQSFSQRGVSSSSLL